MPEPFGPAASQFLSIFFGPENRLGLAACAPGGPGERFVPWIDRLRGPTPMSTILPRRRSREHFDWYALAFHETECRALADDLLAFVGPTYSNFRGRRGGLNGGDPIDQAVGQFTNGRAFVFTNVGKPGDAWKALERMRESWHQRPSLTADTPRSVGRVLRDLHMALRGGDRVEAEAQLAYIEGRGLLSVLNRLFLQVQMLWTLGATRELLALPALTDILRTRRPLAVTHALVDAVYVQELAEFEQSGDAAAAVMKFRQSVLPRFSPLYAASSGLSGATTAKSFLLLSVAENPQNPTLRDTMLEFPWRTPEEAAYAAQIARLLVPSVPSPVSNALEAARKSLDAGDVENALRLALAAPSSLARAQVLSRCAYEAGSNEAEGWAVAAVRSLSTEDMTAFCASRFGREFFDTLVAPRTPSEAHGGAGIPVIVPPPVSWAEWLTRLATAGDFPRALEFARRGAVEWPAVSLLAVTGGAAGAAKLLTHVPPTADGVLAEAIPHFVAALQADAEWPRAELGRVYRAAGTVIALSTSGGVGDFATYVELAGATLHAGTSPGEYGELLAEAAMLCDYYGAAATFDVMLDLLETIVVYPCPSVEMRRRLLDAADAAFARHGRRLRPEQRWLLERLHDDLGAREVFENLLPPIPSAETETERDADPLAAFAGLSVAIYTLNDRAAQVTRDLLIARAPRVTVHVSNDQAGTTRLRDLARNSDVFVISIGSALHAATTFVEQHRPAGKPLLKTTRRSKGSSGLLAALAKYVEQM